ncbi:hypothetical protein D3C81_1097590 [compost metagenome]
MFPVRRQVPATGALLVDVDVLRMHFGNPESFIRISGRVTGHQVAELVRETRRAVAATDDVARIQRGNLVIYFIVEVVNCHIQICKRWREDQADALGTRGFRLQLACTTTGVNRCAGASARVVGSNTQGAAVCRQLVIALFTPADARIDRRLCQEPGLVAKVQLIQARGAI